MNTKTRLMVLAVAVTAAGLMTCSGPSAPDLAEPDYNNPYDERGDAYIPAPDLNTRPLSNIRALEAVSGGEFETDYGKPVTAKGVCWSTEEVPTLEDDCTNDGQGHDAFTSVMDGLEPDRAYYVRAYATNETGTIYGGQRSFSTHDGRPEVSIEIKSKKAQMLRVKGEIISEIQTAPVTSYGVCYDRHPDPDRNSVCISHDGETGSYSIELEGLMSDTPYHIFAYAVNGIGTGLSEILEITTRDGSPLLTTTEPFDITNSSARTGGEITDDGGAPITVRGVCYVEGSGEPALSDSCVEAGTGTGGFEVLLENLSPDGQYTVRAYATTGMGTGWGQEREFATPLRDSPWDTDTEVVEVTSATGRIWMDRNLGASRAARSSTDSEAYGDLYQWGRLVDGHQRRNSSTISTLSDSDQPGHGSFIQAINSPYDWRSPQHDNLWQRVNGINNPCPVGYRLPTEAEWTAEIKSWSSNNSAGAFASPLKLPLAGFRSLSDGSFIYAGSYGNYWSNSVLGSFAQRLGFSSSSADMSSGNRAYGRSVRCIKD